jgi:hypothetical protein
MVREFPAVIVTVVVPFMVSEPDPSTVIVPAPEFLK